MSPIRSNLITLLCVASLVACYLSLVSCVPLAGGSEPQPIGSEQLPFGNDGSLFLTPKACEDPLEELHPGAVPQCEPTCKNPRPICAKMFFSGLDFVPCFCKQPLVRNEQTKQCVQLSECPKL